MVQNMGVARAEMRKEALQIVGDGYEAENVPISFSLKDGSEEMPLSHPQWHSFGQDRRTGKNFYNPMIQNEKLCKVIATDIHEGDKATLVIY